MRILRALNDLHLSCTVVVVVVCYDSHLHPAHSVRFKYHSVSFQVVFLLFFWRERERERGGEGRGGKGGGKTKIEGGYNSISIQLFMCVGWVLTKRYVRASNTTKSTSTPKKREIENK